MAWHSFFSESCKFILLPSLKTTAFFLAENGGRGTEKARREELEDCFYLPKKSGFLVPCLTDLRKIWKSEMQNIVNAGGIL